MPEHTAGPAVFLSSPRVRLGLLAGVLLVVFAAAVVFGGPSRARIDGAVRDSGIAAPVVFVVLYAVLTVLLFPGAVVTAVGGAVFGTALGTALAVVGATLGAAASFLLGRRLGRKHVERMTGRRLAQVDAWLERRGFLAVLYLRLIPAVPFNLLNYAAGVSAVRRRDYLLATAIGIVPGTFAYAALGGSIHDPTSPAFLGAVGLIVVLAVAGPLLSRLLKPAGRSGAARR